MNSAARRPDRQRRHTTPARARRLLSGLILGCVVGLLGAGSMSEAPPTFASQPAQEGVWISPAELAELPTSGPARQAMVAISKRSMEHPDLSNQDDPTNVRVLARALFYARTGDERASTEVLAALRRVRGSERGARVLSVGRALLSYVIAADLVGLDGAEREAFVGWLRDVSRREFKGRTIRSTHEDRPNNWGTHAGATRIAVAIYLGDRAELARAASAFRGWVGEDDGWRGFDFGGTAWQASFFRRYSVNPVESTRAGHSIDGALPDDQRRGGPFEWPPPKENYVYEAL